MLLRAGATAAPTEWSAASVPPSFVELSHELRDEIVEYYEAQGEPLAGAAGLRTLDTNSVLAAQRGRLLLRVLAESGMGPIAGRRVLDLGAGFGSLALYFAHLGADVVAADPNASRLRVAERIAARHGLALRGVQAHAQHLPFADEHFDVVIANNSLCYIVDRGDRRAGFAEILRVLRPGGWFGARNPNRLHPRDQFSGLPIVPMLPPAMADRVVERLGRHRSKVRLASPAGAVRELRAAGFAAPAWRPEPGRGAMARFAGYHHVVARRPILTTDASSEPAAPAAAATTPWLPVALLALAALALAWTQLAGVGQSLWGDEIHSVVFYVNRGVHGIFSNYVPNDHILWELLTWATVKATGSHTEATIRLWGVLPAMLAVIVGAGWLWRRLGAWQSVAFATLAVVSPVFLTLGPEARGYGLSFLFGLLMLLCADRVHAAMRAADAVVRDRSRPRLLLPLAAFGAASLAAIWVLPVAVLPFLGLTAVLLALGGRGRPLLVTVLAVGVGSLAFYAPVLGDVVGNAGQHYGAQLGAFGFVDGPLRDLLAPTATQIAPSLSTAAAEILCAALLLWGALSLRARGDSALALLVLAPALFTFLTLEALRFYVEPRFASFLLLPLLVLVAEAIVDLVRRALGAVRPPRLVARAPRRRVGPLAVAGALVAVAVCGFVLARAARLADHDAAVPFEDYKGVGALVRESGIEPVLTNSTRLALIRYYTPEAVAMSPAALQRQFCTAPAPFVYIAHGLYSPAADTSCLRARGAVRVGFPERRSTIAVWLVNNRPAR
jgi:SAM-dependent methyltransferase